MSYFAEKVNEQQLIIVISTLYRVRKLCISEHEVILRKKMYRDIEICSLEASFSRRSISTICRAYLNRINQKCEIKFGLNRLRFRFDLKKKKKKNRISTCLLRFDLVFCSTFCNLLSRVE